MIRIEIDGITTEAEPGSTIIQIADKLEIPIPRFCYHRKLSVAANCRMCLVQVDKVPKALPACATPIAEGMKVWTTSKAAVDAQKSVMEFLLINHPLDCPICDQGGECELQDVSMSYGPDRSRYTEEKRVVLDQDVGPLIETDMTRCIQCTRCVRFGTEIAGQRELGATGRGEMMEITTFIQKNINSEVSGNIIDLCPVGALTSKPFRFKARAWELQEYPAISVHDCIGSNLYLHVRNNKVMRVVPRNADEINEIWLADRDRYSYQALQHDDRIRQPMLRKQNSWELVSWVEALKYAVAGIKLVIDSYGVDQVGVLAAPSATLEEFYLLQKLARGLGINNIDHRLRQQDFSAQEQAPLYPNLGIDFSALEQQDAILLIGSQIHKELPIVGLKLRKATLRGGKVCIVNPVEFNCNFDIAAQSIVPGGDMLSAVAGIAKAICELNSNSVPAKVQQLLASVVVTTEHQTIAEQLLTGSKRCVLLGQLALMHPQATLLQQMATLIADLIAGTSGTFSASANSAGAWVAGCVPHRLANGEPAKTIGLNALQMLQTPLKCYILYALEPEFDSLLGEQALQTLRQADFVVVISTYQSDTLLEIADVILPLAPYAETAGTMLNIEGKWQTTEPAILPFAESRPGWKILRVLGNLCGLTDFEYTTIAEINANISKQQSNTKWQLPAALNIVANTNLVRIAPLALYSIDSIVRRASALQDTNDAIKHPTVQMHPHTAEILNLKAGELAQVKTAVGKTRLLVEINPAVPVQSVLIYQANIHTNCLGAAYSSVEVSGCLN